MMKKLFCLAVLSCFSFVGCAPATPASNIKPADSNPTGTMGDGAATSPAKNAAPIEAAPTEAAPVTEAPK